MNTQVLHILFYVLFLTLMILNVLTIVRNDSTSSGNDDNAEELQPEVHCLFIHGASMLPEHDADPVQRDVNNLPSKLRRYWGDVKKWTETPNSIRLPCTSYAFTYLDTVHNAWNNESFADVVCKALMKERLRFKPKHQRIFLHSMGNLIFHNALHTQKCSINEFHKVNAGVNAKEENNIYPDDLTKDIYYTHVYSFGGPFEGSEMVDIARKACKAKKNVSDLQWFMKFTGLEHLAKAVKDYVFWPISWTWDAIAGKVKSPKVQELFSLVCDPETHNLTKSFESLDWLGPENQKKHDKTSACADGGVKDENEISIDTINDIYGLSKKYTTGAICGSKSDFTDSFVLNRAIADQLKLFHQTPYQDGVVTVRSCTKVNENADWKSKFLPKDSEYHEDNSNLSDNLFWIVDRNHNAIIGRYGNQQILEWLENRR